MISEKKIEQHIEKGRCFTSKEYRQISNLLKRIRRETGYRYVIPQ